MLLACLYASVALMVLAFVFFPPANNVYGGANVADASTSAREREPKSNVKKMSKREKDLVKPLLGSPTDSPLTPATIHSGTSRHVGVDVANVEEHEPELPTFWHGLVICSQSPTVVLLIVVGGLMQGVSFSWQSTLPMVMDNMGGFNNTQLGCVFLFSFFMRDVALALLPPKGACFEQLHVSFLLVPRVFDRC
jgi:hypothetical protein